MTNAKSLTTLLSATLVLAACGGEPSEQTTSAELEKKAPAVSSQPSDAARYEGTVAKPGAPYSISYRIVGTAIVGSPLTIDLVIKSAFGPAPLILDYRINDTSSMILAESQPANLRMEAAVNDDEFKQQVTVIPQREGRFYLNVSASLESEDGTTATVMAIPVQVGSGTREMQEHGELGLDENEEPVRILSQD